MVEGSKPWRRAQIQSVVGRPRTRTQQLLAELSSGSRSGADGRRCKVQPGRAQDRGGDGANLQQGRAQDKGGEDVFLQRHRRRCPCSSGRRHEVGLSASTTRIERRGWQPVRRRMVDRRRRVVAGEPAGGAESPTGGAGGAPSGLSEAAESDGGAESPTGGAGRRRVACRRYRCGQPGVEWSSGSAVWVPGEAGTTTAKAAVSAVEARSRASSLQP